MATVLCISSRVVRGTVGNALATFVLQRMGHRVWDVPTVLWDRHPGLGPPSGLTVTGAQLAAMFADLQAPAQAAETALVVSGYFADTGQIQAVRDHVLAMRRDGHRPLYCCDPICGDAAGRYVASEVLQGLRELLLPLADVITPNRHELGFLSGLPVASNADIVTAARVLGRPICLVTSAFGGTPAQIADLLVLPQEVWGCETPVRSHAPNGTGDLMTALFAGWMARGLGPVNALGRASAGVQAVLAQTLRTGSEVLAVVAAQDLLLTAPVAVIRQLSPSEFGPHAR